MADAILTITIPEAKVQTATEGFLKIYPNNERNEDQSPKYTTKQWVQEKLRRLLVRDIYRGLKMIADEQAVIEPDDTIAQ